MVQESPKVAKVAFLHPDMNVWNSTNLDCIICALELKNYQVVVYRPNDQKSEHYITYVPRSIFGHFTVLLSYIRFVLCAFHILLDSTSHFDYIIVNEVSYPIPLLRLKCSKILFYCDNPSRRRRSKTSDTSIFFKLLFIIINLIQELTTGMAHTILVDCQFSQRQFQDNYPIISVPNRKKQKNIVYYKK